MAVEKSAVREGTRWCIRGRTGVVVVEEITSKSVIFHDAHGFNKEVMGVDRFLEQAADPLRAEHARLTDGLQYVNHDLSSDSPTGKLLALLRDTAVYLLERMPPTVPPYVEPAPPVPKSEPLPASTVAAPLEALAAPGDICIVPEPPLVEDYGIAMPVDEPPSVKKRRSW